LSQEVEAWSSSSPFASSAGAGLTFTARSVVFSFMDRDVHANPLERPGYRLEFHDEFADSSLDEGKWIPHHLPQWSSRREAAARDHLTERISWVSKAMCDRLCAGLSARPGRGSPLSRPTRRRLAGIVSILRLLTNMAKKNGLKVSTDARRRCLAQRDGTVAARDEGTKGQQPCRTSR
jgi:hypothetical protein